MALKELDEIESQLRPLESDFGLMSGKSATVTERITSVEAEFENEDIQFAEGVTRKERVASLGDAWGLAKSQIVLLLRKCEQAGFSVNSAVRYIDYVELIAEAFDSNAVIYSFTELCFVQDKLSVLNDAIDAYWLFIEFG
jgi:hypothetical protein